MINIKSVRIENFQSHADTFIEFENGLNVIVGPSDQGKSAIIRAMKWVLYNEPRGTDFIRHGASAAKVTIELNNGFRITRERSKSKNRYILRNPDESEAIYEGFGNEVPEEIVKAHGIPKIVMDTDLSTSLNIGDQLEGPFLLSESASLRAKAIGRLTGLHIIDRAIRDCMVDMRRENQTEDRLGKEIDDTLAELEGYKDLDRLGEVISSSENVINKLDSMLQRKAAIDSAKTRYAELKHDYARISHGLDRLSRLKECELLIKSAELSSVRLGSLERVQRALEDFYDEKRKVDSVLNETMNLDECMSAVSDAHEKMNALKALITLRDTYNQLGRDTRHEAKILEYTGEWGNVQAIINEIIQKKDKLSRLSGLSIRQKASVKDINSAKSQIIHDEIIEGGKQMLVLLSEKSAKLENLIKLKEKYAGMEKSICEGGSYLESNRKELDKLLKGYIEQLKKAGRCPLCDSEISDEKLEDMVRIYEEVH